MSDSAFRDMPASEEPRLIDFEKAEPHPGFAGGWILVVQGEAPYKNMDVRLVPRVYVQQPDYWGIEVVGTLTDDVVPDVTGPYAVALPLEGVTGKKGIEVIGANRTQEIDI